MLNRLLMKLAEIKRNPKLAISKMLGIHNRPADYSLAFKTYDLWRAPNLVYVIDPGASKATRERIKKALKAWEKPESPYKFVEMPEVMVSRHITFYSVVRDAVPTGSDGKRHDGHTRRTFEPQVNPGALPLSAKYIPVQFTKEAIVHVANDISAEAEYAVYVHEIGHVLGLPHSPNEDDVMAEATYYDFPTSTDIGTLKVLGEVRKGYVQ